MRLSELKMRYRFFFCKLAAGSVHLSPGLSPLHAGGFVFVSISDPYCTIFTAIDSAGDQGRVAKDHLGKVWSGSNLIGLTFARQVTPRTFGAATASTTTGLGNWLRARVIFDRL